MKYVYIVLFAFVAVALADRREEAKKAHEECQADPNTHIDTDLLKKVRSGEKIEEAKVGAHLLCMNLKTGIQKANGDIDEAKIKEDIEPHIDDKSKIDEIVTECAKRPEGATPENVAIGVFRCLGKHGHKHHEHHHEH